MIQMDELTAPMNEILKELLQKFASVPLSGEMITPQMFREVMEKVALQLEGSKVENHQIDNFEIKLKGRNLPARLYRPSDQKKLPVILFFHGGGWVGGSHITHDNLCRTLCCYSDVLVLSVEYRLAPEHPYPAAVDDALDTYEWLLKNAEQLGANANKIGVCGDSAGACLNTIISSEYAGKSGPSAQVLLCPAINVRVKTQSKKAFGKGYMMDDDQMQWFLQQYGQGKLDLEHPHVSPWFGLIPDNYPDTLVITGGYDPLRDEGIEFAEKLKDNGVDARWSCYGEMIHGFSGFGLLPRANESLKEAAEFFKSVFSDN